jgi:hypothetical protein
MVNGARDVAAVAKIASVFPPFEYWKWTNPFKVSKH